MSFKSNVELFTVLALLVVVAISATIALPAVPAAANFSPALSACNTLLMRDLGTVLTSQVQAATACNTLLMRDLGTVLPSQVQAAMSSCNTLRMTNLGTVLPSQVQRATTVNCDTTTQAAAPAAGYRSATTSSGTSNRQIDGRWRIYNGTSLVAPAAPPASGYRYAASSPAALQAAPAVGYLYSAAPSFSPPTTVGNASAASSWSDAGTNTSNPSRGSALCALLNGAMTIANC